MRLLWNNILAPLLILLVILFVLLLIMLLWSMIWTILEHWWLELKIKMIIHKETRIAKRKAKKNEDTKEL